MPSKDVVSWPTLIGHSHSPPWSHPRPCRCTTLSSQCTPPLNHSCLSSLLPLVPRLQQSFDPADLYSSTFHCLSPLCPCSPPYLAYIQWSFGVITPFHMPKTPCPLLASLHLLDKITTLVNPNSAYSACTQWSQGDPKAAQHSCCIPWFIHSPFR